MFSILATSATTLTILLAISLALVFIYQTTIHLAVPIGRRIYDIWPADKTNLKLSAAELEKKRQDASEAIGILLAMFTYVIALVVEAPQAVDRAVSGSALSWVLFDTAVRAMVEGVLVLGSLRVVVAFLPWLAEGNGRPTGGFWQ